MFEIVRAQPQDAASLKEIALAAKGYWGYPEQLMRQFAQTQIITPGSISKDVVYKALHESGLIGWYRLLIDTSPAVLDDLWVLPAFIGRGYGRALFEHAREQVRTQGATYFELDADPNAKAFYEKLGCVVVGETLSEWGRMIPRMRYSFNDNL